MLELFIISALFGQSCLILFRKWKIDDYIKTSNRLAKYWFRDDVCFLCVGFWFATIGFELLSFLPFMAYVIYPIATIPVACVIQKIVGYENY